MLPSPTPQRLLTAKPAPLAALAPYPLARARLRWALRRWPVARLDTGFTTTVARLGISQLAHFCLLPRPRSYMLPRAPLEPPPWFQRYQPPPLQRFLAMRRAPPAI